MLISLHIKNFAIINEVEVFFKNHLNILTGETGAGKSIIIDSINYALGAKASKDIIRRGADFALIELVFETKRPMVHKAMAELDIPVEDNLIIISRKIMQTRSIYKLNGENVTGSTVSSIAELLIDIHGQHEHQSLIHKAKHLEIVDRFAKDEIGPLKQELEDCYKSYSKIKNEYDSAGMDEEKRLREMTFLEFEINEIKSAALKVGEDDELATLYKKYSNAHNISEGLQTIYSLSGYDHNQSGDAIGRVVKILTKLIEYDENLGDLLSQITDVEELLNGFNRDLSQYISDMDNYEEELDEVSKRLDVINLLKQKYGSKIDDIIRYCAESEKKLEKYRDYDIYMENLKNSLIEEEKRLDSLSARLSNIRKNKSKELTVKIKESLIALNFLDVKFDMVFERSNTYSPNGYDDAEFIISTNPGEDMKSLSKVASGGELSRIMLGIKSVLAENDEIETLIFDEIDTGISGRTAQKVSEQLSGIAGHHQIICITHLAQIAAMADTHFVIDKQTDGLTTETIIKELKDHEIIDELARILGGAAITDRVIDNAKEMKELAMSSKKYK
ncbi:MAG: DNA repair protein RecN [Clostridiales bacterium]|nr:DNA repair protein RecN [Clostridiales bacterium]